MRWYFLAYMRGGRKEGIADDSRFHTINFRLKIKGRVPPRGNHGFEMCTKSNLDPIRNPEYEIWNLES